MNSDPTKIYDDKMYAFPEQDSSKQQQERFGNRWDDRFQSRWGVQFTEAQETTVNSIPSYGITNKKTTVIIGAKKNKKETLEADTEIKIISNQGESYEVEATIGEKKIIGLVLKSDIDTFANKMADLPEEQKKKIDMDTTTMMPLIEYPSYEFSNHNYFIQINGTPDVFRSLFKNVIGSYLIRYNLNQANRTIKIAIPFTGLPTDFIKDESIKKKYNNNTFAFRFTRLEDRNGREMFLIEELGQVKAPAPMDIQNKELKFHKYGFTFYEPSAGEVQNANDLKTEIESNGVTERAKELYPKAFLTLSAQEKEVIIRAVEKMPTNTLETIKNVVFNKKNYQIEDGAVKPMTAAFYNSQNHTVTVIKDIIEQRANTFGDNETEGFSNSAEFTIIHELGHAVDFAPYKEKHTVLDAKRSVYDAEIKLYNQAIDTQKQAYETFLNERTALIKTYKNQITFTNIQENEKGQITNFRYSGTPPHFEAFQSGLKKIEKKYDAVKATSASAKTRFESVKTDYENTRTAASQSRNLSGYGQVYNTTTQKWDVVDDKTAFDEAVEKDSPRTTIYANTNDKESFAEAFALYVTEPETLKTLSPNVYAYFLQKFPR
ncbi:MAG: hypothetical protein MUC49_15485 [Raineya sp.]|jgi:hypothetical protein|nr:hypothetical protein [Raineya sp.]